MPYKLPFFNCTLINKRFLEFSVNQWFHDYALSNPTITLYSIHVLLRMDALLKTNIKDAPWGRTLNTHIYLLILGRWMRMNIKDENLGWTHYWGRTLRTYIEVIHWGRRFIYIYTKTYFRPTLTKLPTQQHKLVRVTNIWTLCQKVR